MRKRAFKPRGQNLKDYNYALEVEKKLDDIFNEALDRGASDEEMDRIEALQNRNKLFKYYAWIPDRYHKGDKDIRLLARIDQRNIEKGLIKGNVGDQVKLKEKS